MDISSSVISGIFTLLGVMLGFFLEKLSAWCSERKRIKKEFLEIKSSINLVINVSYYSYELARLKSFFIRNPTFLKEPENKDFFDEWLVPFGYTSDGYRWSRSEREEMLEDLCDTVCPQIKLIKFIKSMFVRIRRTYF